MAIPDSVPREAWGAKPFPRPPTSVVHTHIEVHHDVYPASLTAEEHCHRIEDQHLKEGKNGPFYNLGLDRDGGLWELRGVGRRSQGTALTVVLFGNYEDDVHLTAAQLTTLARLRSQFPTKDIDWHQARFLRTGEGKASACPGKHVIAVLPTVPIGEGGVFMALTDQEQQELLERVRALHIGNWVGTGSVADQGDLAWLERIVHRVVQQELTATLAAMTAAPAREPTPSVG